MRKESAEYVSSQKPCIHCRQVTVKLERHPTHARPAELRSERPHLSSKVSIWLQTREFLWKRSGCVDCVPRHPSSKELGKLIRDVRRDIDLRLTRARAEMRRQDDVVERPKRVVGWQRFLAIHIKCSSDELPVAKS